MRSKSTLEEKGMDMTPLIDCVFLLLIFFMVTTVFTAQPSLRVDLPKAAESDLPPEKDLNIVIAKTGEMELNGEPVTMEFLPTRLREAKELYRSKVLIIKADKECMHGLVVDVMDAAKGVGIEELAIATEKEEQKIGG
ncbi:biopolymer transporter ExbD [candidate division KSB1 bacterium]|nr:biopolymer transporter ExbD [candidate division KSB1 bacterium]